MGPGGSLLCLFFMSLCLDIPFLLLAAVSSLNLYCCCKCVVQTMDYMDWKLSIATMFKFVAPLLDLLCHLVMGKDNQLIWYGYIAIGANSFFL